MGQTDKNINVAQVNLFYGLNEHGKTYLVEFIYKSLFKNKALSLRDLSASGQVTMSGLEEKESLFSPAIKKKLEDFWNDGLPGLPRDFSKLLVVKGADLDFSSSSPAGIDDKILKEFLSGEGLLEKINSKIKPTESSATYEHGRISGSDKGKVGEYYKIQAHIKQFDDAILEINKNISGGKRFELSHKIEELTEQKINQEQARRHQAFDLANQITDLQAQLDDLPADLIADVDKHIQTYQEKRNDLTNKQKELEQNQAKSKGYPWLESAIADYQKLVQAGQDFKSPRRMIWLVFSLITIVAAILLVLFRQPFIGVGMISLAILFGFLHLRSLKMSQINSVQASEIEKIVKDYRDRFGDSTVVQEATLVAKQKELQPTYFAIEQLTKDIQSLNRGLNDIEQQINYDLKKLQITKTDKAKWQVNINTLQEKRKKMETLFHKKDNELSRLNIAESDYLQEPAAVQFNPKLLATISDELKNYQDELNNKDDLLEKLKYKINGITGEDYSSSWENLVETLTTKRQEEIKRNKDVTASILAQIMVNQVLEDLRKVEEERIEEGLISTAISQALLATTGHYDRVEKEDDELYVADSYGRYRVSDLSTGAREQVLLGLRIGFAARILTGTTLFLILDDAFQHSDWERRERLVKKLFTLSKDGWQIIYFTMDDHIRKLFETNAKSVGKDQYQTISLP